MTALITEAAPASLRHDYVVHGYDGVQAVSVPVSAVNQATAIALAGVQPQGARVHAAWFDCLACREVTR